MMRFRARTDFAIIIGACIVSATLLITNHSLEKDSLEKDESPRTVYNLSMNNIHNFSLSKDDVLVFLHIQKTGGSSFDQYLVLNLTNATAVCKKEREEGLKYAIYGCKNNNGKSWLYTRATADWRCGVHADLSHLNKSIKAYYDELEGSRVRRFLYLTMLRDPYNRYVSEYLHIKRGAMWPTDKIGCPAQIGKIRNISLCHPQKLNWKDVTLQEFIDCPYNPATNRQAWMLADLEAIGCDKLATLKGLKLDAVILESAKKTLEKIHYFTLLDRREGTHITMKQAFGLQYQAEQVNADRKTSAEVHRDVISETQESQIRILNGMDTELYNFASALYNKRYTIS